MMNKPSFGKTLLTTSLAAALLVGGGAALLHSTAYADNAPSAAASAANSTQTSTQKALKNHKIKAPRMIGGNVLKEAAALLGIDEKTLMQELRGGKTLAQIAQEKQNWSEETFVQKLVEALSAKLDDQVKNGKLTQDKADKAKANLPAMLKKAVEGKYRGIAGKAPEHKGFSFGNTADLAKFLNLSANELKSKMKAGESLAKIAQEQGISEDQLIAHIKDSMTDKIKSFVEHAPKVKQQPANQAPAASAPTTSVQ
jgi:uncharacterized protein YidB (DUF937 family)